MYHLLNARMNDPSLPSTDALNSSEALPRRFVIGDIHGHYDGLMLLIDSLGLSQGDQLYFLGDLIDRGPKSAEVVEYVRKNGYPCVRGNHEQMMLEAFPNGQIFSPALHAWMYSGGRATMSSYEDPDMMLVHLQWMENLPSYLDLGDVWLVHAGVHPDMAIEAQTQQQFCWIRDDFHRMEKPYFADKLIITGHTITFTFPGVFPGAVVRGQGWLDIDTGAYHPRSGWLTALDITNQRVHQAHVYEHLTRILPLDEVLIEMPQEQSNRRQTVML
jgi:serine/threonine protein phosphatase 1